MMQSSAKHIGVTFIECLVVVAIIATISSAAIPSFKWLKEIAQQKRVIHQLQAAVLTARHRSVMLGSGTYLCPPPSGEIKGISRNPDCGDNYRSGVAIWSEQVGGWQLLRLWQWSPVTIKNRRGTQVVHAPVAFNARGLANRNITWSTCVGERNLSLVLNRIGRPVTRAGWGRC